MKTLLLSCALITANTLYTAIGCMDKSYHAYKALDLYDECAPIDYKTLYYVACDCPCEQYPWDPKGMRCIRCRHFGRKMNSDRWPVDEFN